MFLGDGDTATRAVGFDEPLDRPWYHVLVDGAAHTTYVAERNLVPDESTAPIQHALVDTYFEGMTDGRYVPRRRVN